jgi:hypothetical protein
MQSHLRSGFLMVGGRGMKPQTAEHAFFARHSQDREL